jgi:ribonuclease HI
MSFEDTEGQLEEGNNRTGRLGGAIIRQDGYFAWNFGHRSRATNNAMELRAVIEASRNLPDDVHVWISMDSAHVKNGIM